MSNAAEEKGQRGYSIQGTRRTEETLGLERERERVGSKIWEMTEDNSRETKNHRTPEAPRRYLCEDLRA